MREKRRSAALSGIAGAGVMIVLSALLVIGSKPLYTAVAGRNRKISEVPIYYAGTYEGTSRGYGGPVTVRTTVSGLEVRIRAGRDAEIRKASAVRADPRWRGQFLSGRQYLGSDHDQQCSQKGSRTVPGTGSQRGYGGRVRAEADFKTPGGWKPARNCPVSFHRCRMESTVIRITKTTVPASSMKSR